MRRFATLTVGSLTGLSLVLGLSGMAAAAPVTTVGATVPTSPSTTGPSTTSPSTTSPSTTGPSTTGPSTTSPSTPAPAPAKSSPPKVLTGNEIWWIVRPHHVIDCVHAAKQVQRIRTAESAAGKRAARWQVISGAEQKVHGTIAAKRAKVSSGRVKGFQKLAQDGAALIARIDAKCSVTSTTA
jgi:hypothetical protein